MQKLVPPPRLAVKPFRFVYGCQPHAAYQDSDSSRLCRCRTHEGSLWAARAPPFHGRKPLSWQFRIAAVAAIAPLSCGRKAQRQNRSAQGRAGGGVPARGARSAEALLRDVHTLRVVSQKIHVMHALTVMYDPVGAVGAGWGM
jgi:hypothetical protein